MILLFIFRLFWISHSHALTISILFLICYAYLCCTCTNLLKQEHLGLMQARGAPRQNASAKDSEWVRTRQALEKDKPPDVNEVVPTELV